MSSYRELRLRAVLTCLLALMLMAAVGPGATAQLAAPPEASPQVLVVPFETPVPFELWDPLEAELDELTFVLIRLPDSGTLIGIPPELIFIPDPGFSGTDWVSFAVENPYGQFDIANVQLVVLGPEVRTSPPSVGLSGGLSASGMPVTLGLTALEATYAQRFPFFDQQVRATATRALLTSLTTKTRLEFVVPMDPVIRIPVSSTLAFDPTGPALSGWTVDARIRLPAVEAGWILYYDGADPDSASYSELRLQPEINGIRLDSRTRLDWPAIRFSSQTLSFSGRASAFGCPGCDFSVRGTVSFTKDMGFESLRLTLRDIPIPIALEHFELLSDVRVTYAPDDKSVSPSLKLRRILQLCVRPLFSLATTPPLGIEVGEFIHLWGFEIRCDFPDGQGLRLATSFDERKDASVTGDSRFFEVWQAYGPVLPCCGPRGRWQITKYFKRDEGTLFGWGMTELVLHFPLNEQVLINLTFRGGEVDPSDPSKTWSLTLGMKGLW